jgi:hypothetical protein
VKLRGRAEAPAIGAEGAEFPSARGDNTEAPHGPLERLLEDALIEATVRALQYERNEAASAGFIDCVTGHHRARRDSFERRVLDRASSSA